ncbi:MAG: right-handed parallel beta-helix repeat-containing protein [Myxococcota bacterium]|nr:right-handed parallel beta-helix repeat-containing protein [Myxococcota bacterium]
MWVAACGEGIGEELLTETCPEKGRCRVFVDVDVKNPGLGECWDDAFVSVQEGIDAAYELIESKSEKGLCEVWVARGVYYTFVSAEEDTITLKPGVSVFGGFSGNETGFDDRDILENETVLHAAKGPNSSRRVKTVVTGSTDSVLDGFTIAHAAEYGMDNKYSDPRVSNCTFMMNATAGMTNDKSAPVVKHCVFKENANRGMKNHESSPRIVGCTFDNNGTDGLLNTAKSSPDIRDCRFINNLESGMYNLHASSPTVTNCVFVGNGNSGVINKIKAEPTFLNCIFRENTAFQDDDDSISPNGGAIKNYHSCDLTVVNSLFIDNTAAGTGGAIYSEYECSTMIKSCSFIGNVAQKGGDAISTIKRRQVTIENSILWNGNQREIWNPDNSLITIRCSDIGGGGDGADEGIDNISEDPLLDEEGRLLSGSPCIDRGDIGLLLEDISDVDGNGNTAEKIPWDLDGMPRIVGEGVDMGAYEFVADDPDGGTGLSKALLSR